MQTYVTSLFFFSAGHSYALHSLFFFFYDIDFDVRAEMCRLIYASVQLC